MQATELKRYLYEDVDRIYKSLEHFDFHEIWQNSSEEIRCALPGHENKTSVAVKLTPELFATSYSDDMDYRGDILGLFESVSGKDFAYVIRQLHRLFNLSFNGKSKKVDLLKGMRKYKKGKSYSDFENEKYAPSILNKFVPLPHKSIIEEAISPSVCRQFNICFDPVTSRIIIPHFDWVDTDKVVGLVGRHTESNPEILKSLNITRYFNLISGYRKSSNLFAWSESKEFVDKHKKLVIFEAEKSVMKLATIEKGEGYAVSVGGHEISSAQVDFILKNTDTDTEIIIAFDKDIMIKQAEQDNKNMLEGSEDDGDLVSVCRKFSKFRKTSYVFDNYGLIEEKDSPIDRGVKRWRFLEKHRIEVKD